ncbi:hypothetical protein B0919_12505 [Hymenobacter sp. CRA2]|nr:hypothetical protein B0919_12505 [Hymenobacter sp. CRA2]
MLLAAGFAARATAQTPDWNLALPVGGASPVLIQSIVADSSDNVYLAGSFYDTATFGHLSLTSQGSEDIFVAKWNRTTQRFVWVQRAGGPEADHAAQLVRRGPYLYLTGECQSTDYTFGALHRRNAGFTGNTEAFVAKLTDAGPSSSFAWVQPLGTGQAQGTALAVEGSRVYAAGTFYGPLRFATFTLPNNNLPGYGTQDIFVAAVDDQGSSASVAWADRAGGIRDDFPTALAVSGHQIYLSGAFYSPVARFGSTDLPNNDPERHTSDAFVAKLTDNGSRGQFVWARGAGGWFHDQFSGVAVQGPNVYAVGSIGTAVDFGPLKARTAGTLDMVVAKLVDAGPSAAFKWVQTGGGAGYEEARSVAVQGNVLYVSGELNSGDNRFGNLHFRRQASIGTGVFVTRLTDLGEMSNFDWVREAHGATNGHAYAFAQSGQQLYLAAGLPPSAQLGQLPATPLDTPQILLLGLTDTQSSVFNTPASSLEVFPNPATNALWVRLPTAGAAPVRLQVLDMLGRVVLQRTEAVTEAGLLSQVPVTQLASGTYVLRVQAGPATAATQRFVVTR